MRLDGILAGVVTPFDDDGRVDEASLLAHLAQLAEAGVDSVVVCAETGEGHHLRQGERMAILKLAAHEIGAEVPVLTGLIANFTAEAVERARAAEAAGAMGLQVFPPPAFLGPNLDPGQAAGYIEAIADATELPLIVYRPPLELGYGLDEAVLRRIVKIDGVAALKESSFDPAIYPDSLALIRAAERDVVLLSGADTFVLDSMAMGFDGLALAIAAVAPGVTVEVLRSWRANGGAVEAETKNALDSLATTIFAPPFRDFRSRLKEGLRQLGVIRSSSVRGPLAPLGPKGREAVGRMLAQCRLPEAA